MAYFFPSIQREVFQKTFLKDVHVSFLFREVSSECVVFDVIRSFRGDSVVEQVAEHRPSIGVDGRVILLDNVTCQDMLDNAFDGFCSETSDVEILKPVFDFVAYGLNSIVADKVSVDGNAETGKLNIAFRLPDGVILSVTKFADTLSDNLVAFNILKKRKLILSDIIDINLLSDYVRNVQHRMA